MRVTISLNDVYFDVIGTFYHSDETGGKDFDIKSITMMDPKAELINFFTDDQFENIVMLCAEAADSYLKSMRDIEKEGSL